MQVSVPTGGKPSAAWFERVLAAEREALVQVVAQRHHLLLADLKAKLTTDLDIVEVDFHNDVGYVTRVEPFVKRSNGIDVVTTQDTASTAMEDSKVAWGEHKLPGSTVPDSDVARSAPLVGRQSACSVSVASADTTRLSELKQEMGAEQLVDVGKNFFARLVADTRFELAVSALIMCNAIVIAVEIQYEGLGLGRELDYRWYDGTSEETWPGGKVSFEVIDYFFGIIFTLELIFKVLGHRVGWLRDVWNYLDAAIVVFWMIETPFSGSMTLPVDAVILRTARFFRLLRLVKLMRALHGLDALYLMLTTLRGCFYILSWSAVMLFVTQLLVAMLFWFALHEAYFRSDFYPLEDRQKVFEYFGTFSRAMITTFELTVGNWAPICRLLMENVSEWFMPFVLFHKLTMGFAVIGVINGVFMQETFKVASTDDRIMLRQVEREVKVHTAKMIRLFKAADESGDGCIDKQEFKEIMQDKEILNWLSSMEIPVRDPVVLYAMLDKDGDGELTCEELVRGALMLRGAAKAVDVLEIKEQMKAIKRALKLDDVDLKRPPV